MISYYGVISPSEAFYNFRAAYSFEKVEYFAVWTYPHPPPRVELDPEEKLYCSYAPCAPNKDELDFYREPFVINLRQFITSPKVSKSFDQFIQHHMWYKFVHGENFPHHVQSIASLSILMTNSQACVRTLGQDRSTTVCAVDIQNYKYYDPTNVNSVPPFSVQYMDMPTHYGVVDFHSETLEDEMQSLSSLQFMPYLTNIVDTRMDFPQVHGKFHLFMNGRFGEGMPFPTSLGDDTFVTMLSMHIEEEFHPIMDNRLETFEKYNDFGAIGAMDSDSLAYLQSKGLDAYLSSSFTSMMNVYRRGRGSNKGGKHKILLVDCQKDAGLPKQLMKLAEWIDTSCSADMETQFRMKKAFELTKTIAKARVVITFKLQSAMIAMAHGVPVILVGDEWQMDAETQGNAWMFHRHVPGEKFEHDYLNMPTNPGVHQFDRHRASFLHHLKKRSLVYYDTANLFGMLPMQRVGEGIELEREYESVKEIQFVITTTPDTINWRIMSTIEAVFFFHPNAKVIIHSNTITQRDTKLDLFFEAGYDLEIRGYSFTELLNNVQFIEHEQKAQFLKRLEMQVKQQYWWVHEVDLIRMLILEQRGGVMMDTDMHLLQPIPTSFVNVAGWLNQEADTIGTGFLAFEKHNPFLQDLIIDALHLNNNHYDKGKIHFCPCSFVLHHLCLFFQNFHDFLSNILPIPFTIASFSFRTLSPERFEIFGSDLITNHYSEILEVEKGTEDLTILQHTVFYAYDKPSTCFTTNRDAYYPIVKEFSFGIHMNTREKREVEFPLPGSVCDEMLRQHCIFCDGFIPLRDPPIQITKGENKENIKEKNL